MNFFPGSYLGEDSSFEVGFRPEWTELGNGIKAIVDSMEAFGDSLYLFCTVDQKYRVILPSKE